MASQARILIVDDEPDVCRLVAEFLESRGYAVQTAGSGAEAIAVVSGRSPGYLPWPRRRGTPSS
jgi:CheY-like chemotaxis protein